MPTVRAFQIESAASSGIVLAGEVVAHGGVYYFYNGGKLVEQIPFLQLLRPPVPIYGLTDHEKLNVPLVSDEEVNRTDNEGGSPPSAP